MHVGLGTDIGGGTSFSLLHTMGEAYRVAQLNGRSLSAVEAFFLATLGGARVLALDDRIGAMAPGREADLVVLDPKATPLLTLRNAQSGGVEGYAVRADDARRRLARSAPPMWRVRSPMRGALTSAPHDNPAPGGAAQAPR